MLEKLISECTDFEFKEKLEIVKPKSWLKTVVAFANGIGGKIFFGINNNKELCSILNPQETIEKITELINARITPRPLFTVIPFEEEKHVFIELKISAGNATPYYYCHDNTKVPYIRSGASTIETPEYILHELILKGTGKTYDSLVTGYKKSDFAFSILESEFFTRTNTKFSAQDYVSFGLATIDGFLTNAGVLLADNNNFKQSRLFCTRWNGFNKTNEEEVKSDREFNGSLIRQLKLALDFFDAHTNNKWHKVNDNTIYEPDYDREAIFEALVNGIIHRNYNMMGAEVCLNIYDDRIEITSPGEMVSGNPLPLFITEPFESIRRNPVLADLFWKMNYMNRRGSGLAKITFATNKLFPDNKNHVSYFIRNNFFVVKIDNANFYKNKINSLSQRQKTIILLLKNGPLSLARLCQELNLSNKTVNKELTFLLTLGLITYQGMTNNKLWMLSK